MNILHIASNYHPEVGGPASSVPNLARELIKRGHPSFVLTRDATDYPSFEILDGIPVYRSTRIPGNFYNPVVAISKSIAMGLKGRKVIEKEKIDIIHSHDINVSAIAGIIASKLKDVKKVVKLSGSLSWELLALIRQKDKEPEEFFEKQDFLTNVLEKTQRTICNDYEAIIAPSEYMRNILVKYTGIENSKIQVICNGISVEYSRELADNLRKKYLGDSKYLVVSACRMMPWKGMEYLIEAFKTLPKNIRLVLIGDGVTKEKIRTQAKGLNVIFLSKMLHREVQTFMAASDIYIMPSVYENFPLAALDCLVTGTPIIATNVGGTPEIITNEKTGLLIKPRDPKAITKSIERLLYDTSLYENIKQNQRIEYKKYLWENVIDRYLDVYGRVLDGKI